MSIWYSLWSFGIFFPFWYVRTETNLATLLDAEKSFAGKLFEQTQISPEQNREQNKTSMSIETVEKMAK
jgi:uncharacterized membrane protein YccC